MGKVVIVGGGIAGLFTAYYLLEEGFEVTILDKGNLTDNCSTGNAGMIVPSHIVPLASPGIIGKGLKWMFSPSSPFYIHPKLDRKLVQWCLLFYKSATKKHVESSIPYLKNLGLLSKSLFMELAEKHASADFGLENKGLLMLYRTEEAAQEEREFAQLAKAHGIAVENLAPEDVQKLEPNIRMEVNGAVLFPGDAHLDPGKLNRFLIKHLREKGVRIIENTEVTGFSFSGKTIENVVTNKGDYQSDYLIVCAGSLSGKLADKLKVNLPMLAGKGYSFLAQNAPAIQRPAILVEGKVAVTPYGDKVRFGGTMEITQSLGKVNLNRVKGIHQSISKYYSDFQCEFPAEQDIWTGLRPCSPDGLPYIGFTQRWDNVLFGTGHSMMGISLAPATGKVLAETIKDRKTSMLIDAFSPDRYG